jgi:hypothetical protein
MALKSKKEETIFDKERRLKKRKQSYTATHKNGLFYNNPAQIIEYINQKDVLIRVHSAGSLDDDTAFINITIEGFKEGENGI